MIFLAKYIIGIDGGLETGFAVWDTSQRALLNVSTLDFWTAYEIICRFDKDEVAIIIEDPGVNKPTFHRKNMRRSILDRKAQNVGSVKRETILLGEGLERQGFKVKYVAPISGGKWDDAEMKRITGWTFRTSQHARDAARLVFQRGSRISFE